MEPERDLVLRLRFASRGLVTPSELAAVLGHLDELQWAAVYSVLFEPSGQPEVIWRGYPAEVPPLRADYTLRVQSLQMGSPLEIVTQIPWEFAAAAGTGSLWFFLGKIEKVWNMRGRIRVEAARLKADEMEQTRRYWEELAKAQNAYEGYSRTLQQGRDQFILTEGELTDSRLPPGDDPERPAP